MNEQEIKKSVENIVDEILSKETSTTTEVKKSELVSAEIASTESTSDDLEKAKKEKAEKESKKDEDKEEDKKESKKHEKKESPMEEKKEMKKAEACEEDKDDKKEYKKEDKKLPKKMKKSLEELSDLLDEEELELIKAWREDETTEVVAKSETSQTSSEDLQKALSSMIDDRMNGFKKILDEKENLIKSLNEKVEKISSQPAYDKRSISTLETLEKSNEASTEIKKSQVLQKLLDLQMAGRGVTSHHVAEFESTNNISDSNVRNLVFKELKLN